MAKLPLRNCIELIAEGLRVAMVACAEHRKRRKEEAVAKKKSDRRREAKKSENSFSSTFSVSSCWRGERLRSVSDSLTMLFSFSQFFF